MKTSRQKIKLSLPASWRERGGELAAEDCWLDGYHGDSAIRPSYEGFVGEVEPDVICGVATVEYLLGDTLVEIIFGVAAGVSLGVIYGDEYLCPICFPV